MEWLWSDNKFVLFGPYHLAALAATAAAALAVVWAGRRMRGRPGQVWLSRGLALLVVVSQGGVQIATLLPRYFDIEVSLPLQICHVAWIVGVYALWTQSPWAFAILYYWGLTFTVLASITPALDYGFPNAFFFQFFWWHAIIVAVAAYLTWGVGMRPTWGLYRMILVVTACYAAILYPLNMALGTNYMFINRKPHQATILDHLGPHPVYVAIGVGLAIVVWAAMTWPWEHAARHARITRERRVRRGG